MNVTETFGSSYKRRIKLFGVVDFRLQSTSGTENIHFHWLRLHAKNRFVQALQVPSLPRKHCDPLTDHSQAWESNVKFYVIIESTNVIGHMSGQKWSTETLN